MKIDLQIKADKKNQALKLFSPQYVSNVIDNTPDDIFLKNGTIHDDIESFFRKYSKCSTLELYATNEKEIKKVYTNKCGNHKFCPICSTSIQSTRKEKFFPIIEELSSDKNIQWYFVTFTLVNDSNLYQMIDNIQKSFRLWIKKGNRKFSNFESKKIIGALKNLEITMGKDGRWNVHLHTLLACNDRLDYNIYDYQKAKKISKKRLTKTELDLYCKKDPIVYNGKTIGLSKITREWFDLTGSFVVHCVNLNKKCKKNENLSDHIKTTAKEVLKYQNKPNSVNSINFPVLFDALKYVRTFESYLLFSRRGKDTLLSEEKKNISFIGYDINYISYSFKTGNMTKVNIDNSNSFKNKFTNNYNEYLELKKEAGKILGHYNKWLYRIIKLSNKYAFFSRFIELKKKIKLIMKKKLIKIYNKELFLLFDFVQLEEIKEWGKSYNSNNKIEMRFAS